MIKVVLNKILQELKMEAYPAIKVGYNEECEPIFTVIELSRDGKKISFQEECIKALKSIKISDEVIAYILKDKHGNLEVSFFMNKKEIFCIESIGEEKISDLQDYFIILLRGFKKGFDESIKRTRLNLKRLEKQSAALLIINIT